MNAPAVDVAAIEKALMEHVRAGVTVVCVVIDPSAPKPQVITNAAGVPRNVAEILQRIADCWWRAAREPGAAQ